MGETVRNPAMNTYALFSGGHDSLCATHLAMTNGWAQGVVHVNTGIGIETTRHFVRLTCLMNDWPLHELHPPITYDEIVIEHGFPGPAQHPIMYRRLKERALRAFARDHKPLTYCSGVRRQESTRRMRHKPVEYQHDPNGWTWRAVILDWTKADVNQYIDDHNLPRNPVVDLLHMSGECLCGSFARPGERDEIALWFPDTHQRIADLEEQVRAAGHHGCIWGHRPPNVNRQQLSMLDIGPLCTSCQATS
jgi:3'-phosphoadenosine 5'-phosphosulfate sulfotransferase (PAPS reductase)/FAD synthetase